jgi:hypothetical protein
MIILFSRQPSSPTSIYENTTIGAELDVDISATDEDSDPQLSFAIDWDNSRAAKQGMQTNKEDFKKYVCRRIYLEVK